MTEIGSIIEFDNGKGAVRGRATAGSVFVDRLGDFEPGKVRLRTRDDLASDGLVTITIIVDAETGKLIAGPEFVTKGLSLEVLAGPLRQAEQELKRWLERRPEGEPEVGYLVSQAKGITATIALSQDQAATNDSADGHGAVTSHQPYNDCAPRTLRALTRCWLLPLAAPAVQGR